MQLTGKGSAYKYVTEIYDAYEAATLTFFRLESQLQIASLTGDVKASEQLAFEVGQAAVRRRELMEAARRQDVAH